MDIWYAQMCMDAYPKAFPPTGVLEEQCKAHDDICTWTCQVLPWPTDDPVPPWVGTDP